MRKRLQHEWHRLLTAARTLDRQTVFVLLAALVLVLVQHTLGSRRFYRQELAPLLGTAPRGLGSWAWWFGIQGVTGFVLPVFLLRGVFKQSWRAMGLGLGDWRLASILALAYLPLVALGTWVLSADPSFQMQYPHYRPAAFTWWLFAAYHLFFLFYWIGWEYLWRGFVLFGTARTFGLYAIFVQTVPFALLHLEKPFAEALLSIVGGVALGALVWRCGSFWIAVPIHAAQMLILDIWCALRLRTGVDGIGPGAFAELMGAWLNS